MHRKLIALSLIGLLPLCWAMSEGPAEKVEAEASSRDVSVEQIRPFKIFYWSALPNTPVNIEDQLLAVELMERTGIEFDVEYAGGQDAETKLSLYFASGDYPDLWYTNNVGKVREWKELGVTIGLQRLLERHGDNIMKSVNPEAWPYITFDGDVWAIPKGSRPEPYNRDECMRGLVARWDWVEKLGYAAKAQSDDFDLDDYYGLVKAMTMEDPDGNDKNDTYGLVESFNGDFLHLQGAFGLVDWMQAGDRLVAKHMSPNYKDFLRTVRDWFEEGLIDPEFVVSKEPQLQQKFINSKAGTRGYFWFWVDPGSPLNNALRDASPSAELKMIVPPKGPLGQRGVQKSSPVSAPAVISNKCPQPEMLMQLLNYLASEEGHNLAKFGIEGENFTYDATANRINLIPPYDKQAEFQKLGAVEFFLITDRRWANEATLKAVGMTNTYAIPSEFYGQVPAMANAANLDKDITETRIKYIMGQIGMDEVDRMRERWLANGGQEITDQVNAEWRKMK